MKKAAMYIFSRTNDEKTISAQISNIEQFCSEFGYKIIEKYIDIMDSSKAYFKMMMELDKFEAVIVYRFDVINSKCDSVFKLENELKEKDVELISVVESERKIKAEKTATSVFGDANEYMKNKLKSQPLPISHQGRETS